MSRGIIYKEIRRSDGGRVSRDSLSIGQESFNMIRDGQNIRLRSGAPKGRKGAILYSDFSATAIAGQSIGPLYEYAREYNDGGDSAIWYAILFSVGSNFYYAEIEDDPDTVITITTSMSGGDFYAANAFDFMFVATGKDTIYLFDGNVGFIECGIAQPSLPAIVSVTPGGSTHQRWYKITEYNDSDPMVRESEDNAAFAQALGVTEAAVDVVISYTQATDTQVTHYRIWGTETFEPGVDPDPVTYYLLATVSIADAVVAGHQYNDTVENSGLSAEELPTTYREQPPKFKYILWHDNVMYGAGIEDDPNAIVHSAPNMPFYWSETFYREEVSRDDGDILTGLGAIGATRFMFKRNSIWEWSGDPTANTAIIAVERPNAAQNMTRLGVGCSDPRSLCSWMNTLIFRASDNHVYMLTQSDIIQLTRYALDWMDNLTSGDSIAVVHDDYYIISEGLFTYVCDLRKREFGWQGRDFPVSPTNFLVDHNGFCLGSDGDGIVRYYTGTTDQGAVISKEIKYPFIACAPSHLDALARQLIVTDKDRTGNYIWELYDETNTLINTGTYLPTDRLAFMGGGRSHFFSPKFSWTDETEILLVELGFTLSRRH